jgi:hypothetical protein
MAALIELNVTAGCSALAALGGMRIGFDNVTGCAASCAL